MDQELDAAVDWWADVLASPPGHQEAGDAVINASRTLLGMITYTPLREGQIALFREALRAKIARELDIFGGAWCNVATDYGAPIGTPLGDALAAAGIVDAHGHIEDARLPIKTVMWLEPGRVAVARGRGAPVVQVWPRPEREEAGSAGHPYQAPPV